MNTGNSITEGAERDDIQMQEEQHYNCPVCGHTLYWDSTLYRVDGEIVGCEECAQKVEVWAEYDEI